MPSDPPAAESRRVLRIGKYEILKHIATGGMGAVYRARDTEDGREVALKVLTPDIASKPAMLIRFKREAEHAKKLNHENIVKVYDFGESNGTWYMAMEFVEGIDLYEYTRKKKRLDPEVTRQLMIQATRALEHAHSCNLVHRDIKPSNFLRTKKKGKVIIKLTDMGLARESSGEEFRVTRAGTTVGTVDYIAPEQARNSGSADIRSDLYSLGCTWFHLLTGNPPFPDGELAERLIKHMMDKPPDVRTINPRVSPELKAIIDKLLAKKPEDRYQTPSELLEALETVTATTEPGLAVETVPDDAPLKLEADEEVEAVADEDSAPRPETLAEDEERPAHSASRPTVRYVGTRRLPPGQSAAPAKEEAKAQAPTRAAITQEVEQDEDKPAGQDKNKIRLLIGGGVLAVAGLVAVFAFNSGEQPKKKKPSGGPVVAQQQQIPQQVTVPDKPKEGEPKEGEPKKPDTKEPDTKEPDPPDQGTEVLTTPPKLVTEIKSDLPLLYKPKVPLEADKLRAEIDEPWTDSKEKASRYPAMPADAPILRVSRVPDGAKSASYPTLAAALAAAPATGAIVEIHDNGPLYESGATGAARHLHIRAGKGYRPLIVWDVVPAKGEARRAHTFLTMQKGHLTLEGIEFVLRWPDVPVAGITYLHVVDGDLTVRQCTFSISDPGKRGVTLARLSGPPPLAGPPPPRCRISDTYARGISLTALDLETPGCEVLIDNCLLAGGDPGLVKVKTMDQPVTRFRVVRSTLVCNKTLFHLQPHSTIERKPGFLFLGWDALLARSNIEEGGDLVLIDGDHINLGGMGWRAVNCLYTGWQNLTNTKGQALLALEPSAWWRQWNRPEGDVMQRSSWPAQPFAELFDKPAASFRIDATDKTVYFASTQSPDKPLGCDLGRLPATRDDWLAIAMERNAAGAIDPLTDLVEPPMIPPEDAQFHGMKIELTAAAKIDVTSILELKKTKLAPRVILHLVGTGEHWISPIKLPAGVSLVIYVEPAKDPPKPKDQAPKGAPAPPKEKPPLPVLYMTRRPETDALIDVEAGSLELYNAEIRLRPDDDNKFAENLPHWLLRVRGGDLKLCRSKLIGPQAFAPRGYLGLIDLAGSGDASPDKARLCQATEAILVSSQQGVNLTGIGLRLALQQTLLATGGDAITFDPGAAYTTRANTQFLLDKSTIATRRAVLSLKPAPNAQVPAELASVQSRACAFLQPFPTPAGSLMTKKGPFLAHGLTSVAGLGKAALESARAGMLRADGPALGQGFLLWQGDGDLIDPRFGYVAAGDKALPLLSQPGSLWQGLWGSANIKRTILDWPLVKTLPDGKPWPLDRLALPSTRPSQIDKRAGADLELLGIVKKTPKR